MISQFDQKQISKAKNRANKRLKKEEPEFYAAAMDKYIKLRYSRDQARSRAYTDLRTQFHTRFMQLYEEEKTRGNTIN